MPIKSPSDSAVRAAALDPRRSFIIQAPAGSGKTELLTDRILALLATVDRPEEIVAITFTRKAAAEMHARVLAKLRAGRGDPPLEPHRLRSWELAQKAIQRDDALGWNLLAYPARLSIRTIDAFCSYLVRAMPWLSALGGVPPITDDARAHFEGAARATLAMADDYEAVATLIAHLDVDVRVAEALLATMLGSRDQWLPLLADSGDVEQLRGALNNAIERDLVTVRHAMPAGWAAMLAPCLSQAACVLAGRAGSTQLNALQDWDGTPFGTAAKDLPKWQALACALLTKANALRSRIDKNLGFDAGSVHKTELIEWLKGAQQSDPWVTALAGIRCAPAAGYEAGQIEILRALVKVLWLTSAQLTLRFSEAAEVDFIEIAQRALRALGQMDDPSDLLLMLDTSIKHVLIDEFQDTSQSQIDLLQRLTAGWMHDDGRTLFLVGDPMQSIYRFRKADVSWFIKVKEQGLGDVTLTPLRLTDNFRSQANVVDWVNKTFDMLFPALENPMLGAISYSPSVPFNAAVAGLGVEFHPVWVRPDADSDDKNNSAATAEAIAIALAKEALARHPDSEHPVAILVRARSHLDNLVLRLRQENIPCRAVELVSLKDRQVVNDLVQLARAMSHPADRLAWLAFLRSPVCGLTLESLDALFGCTHHLSVPAVLQAWMARDAHDPAPLSEPEASRLRRAASIVLDASNESGLVPFAAWLQACWIRLGGPAVYSSTGEQADAERLFRQIEKLAPYGALNPAELDARLGQLYAVPDSTGHAVEVMTIHKAKGLEFDTVILTGMHRRPHPDTAPLLRFEQNGEELLLGPIKHRILDDPDPVSLYLADRDKKRADYETDRLLYVAVTRAREQLHLIGAVSLNDDGTPKIPSASCLLGRLWTPMSAAGGLPVPPPVAEISAEGLSVAAAAGQRYLVRIDADSLPPVAVQTATVAAPTQMAWTWRLESGDESTIGTVAHAWLERIGKDGAQQWPVQRINDSRLVVAKQLSRAGVSPPRLEAATQAVCETLLATLSSPKGLWLLNAARAHREWSLLDLSGRVSVIDLAISQESGWLVVDYKTGFPQPDETRDAFSARMRGRYLDQIRRYCDHVSALDGRNAQGVLYFPRADVWIDC